MLLFRVLGGLNGGRKSVIPFKYDVTVLSVEVSKCDVTLFFFFFFSCSLRIYLCSEVKLDTKRALSVLTCRNFILLIIFFQFLIFYLRDLSV